ncbi:MAG: hypothetical protein C4543_00645 [Ignavibacteriales bacterium]|nr:MAG: hypothetical protein C4543_00645 [Ignavibacteriales bacterium]
MRSYLVILFEYAVDPNIFQSWTGYQQIIPDFGVTKGRLISEFPELIEWKRMAASAIRKSQKSGKLKPIKAQTLVAKVQKIDNKFISSNRKYNFDNPWLVNAIEEDKIDPFHAIITIINPDGNEKILKIDDFDRDTEPWKVNTQCNINRTSQDMADCVERLLKHGHEVIFVDPHFNPVEPRFLNPLSKLLDVIAQLPNIRRIEYHLLEDSRIPKQGFINSCQSNVAPICPSGINIKFVRWQQLPGQDPTSGGKRLHPRFILTDKGGIMFDPGLDEGVIGDKLKILLLDEDIYLEEWSNYQRSSSPFNFIDELVITGSKTA